MNSQEYMQDTEQQLLHTYNRYQVVLDKGEGVYLYDMNGKKYLDFGSGIGVMAYGYNNQEYKDALKEQIDKVMHVSNLFYSTRIDSAAKRLKKISGMDRVFFTNSGAEAIEGALKAAKKYAYTRDQGSTDHEIIAMNHSFHGRTLGALSVTGTKHYREPFEKLIPGIRFADFNDIESVRAQVTDKTCAIIVELLQGEGGIYPATEEFVAGLKQLQEEKDILLIFDEVQCGVARTGRMFTYQHYDVQPDIVASAKALGCGVPVGAFLLTERVAQMSLKPGDHGTTYGGNPFVCAAVDKVLEMMERDDLAGHVREIAPYLEKRLDELVEKYPQLITERRGKGLMQGLQLTIAPNELVKKAMDKGLILLTAGSDVLRLLPPLIIEKEDVDNMIQILDETLSEW